MLWTLCTLCMGWVYDHKHALATFSISWDGLVWCGVIVIDLDCGITHAI